MKIDTTSKPLTRKNIADLAWAVSEAQVWRGSMTGNPDPEPLKAFDTRIRDCKTALAKLHDLKERGAV